MALNVQQAGADLMGFVFAPSKRSIEVKAAASICRKVNGVAKVGVFVNALPQRINEIAQLCQLDYVQLHGDESSFYARLIERPIIKAYKWHRQTDLAAVQNWPANWLLFDSVNDGQFGGTGQRFGWQELANQRLAVTKSLIVAGGLTPENVGDAIAILRPDGVDVSSGVETDGEKDADKIYQFIAAARAAERMMNLC